MKCPYCGYTWKERVKNPKRCPLCGHWLDYWLKQRKKRSLE